METSQQPVNQPVRGVRVRTLNFVMIFLSCVLYLALLVVTYHAAGTYDQMVSATNEYIESQKNAAMLSEASDYLTDQTRMFVVTMDPAHMDHYFEEIYVTCRRKLALTSLNEQASPQALEYMEKALDYSNQLMQQEIYAMGLAAQAGGLDPAALHPDVAAVQLSEKDRALSPEEQLDAAQEMVFGPEYQASKELINSNIDFFLSDVIASTQSAQAQSVENLNAAMLLERVFFSILFVQNLVVFIMIIWLIVKPLQVYVNCIKEEKMMEITGAYEFKYLALTYNDIYEINAANEVLLRHQAEHDPLTGIMNRGAFEQVRHVLKIKAQPVALLIVDVDKFKQINDGYGHETGDRALKKVARLLVESFRSTDFPARVGGDEFAVVLTDIAPSQQRMVENKVAAINAALQNPEDGLPKLSLSVGGAFSENGFTEELYSHADAALYQVKENGRCGCRFYEEGMPIPGQGA